MAGEHRFDLAQLDAEAAHLDLMVDAAQVVHLAVRQEAHEVAGAVHAVARPAARADGERIGQVALGGHRRPVEVAAGEAGAAQEQLARHAEGRDRRQIAVEQAGGGAVHRPADGRRAALAAARAVPGGVGGVLGRAVEVADGAHAGHAVDLLDQRALERLAAQVDGHDRRRDGPHAHQLGGGRGHGVDQAHLGSRGVLGQVEGVPRQDQLAAPAQGDEDLEHRHVEADGGRAEDALELLGAPDALRPVGQHHGRPVRDRHALGPAGRARGVDEIGEVVGLGSRERSIGVLGVERSPQRIYQQLRHLGQPLHEALLRDEQAHPAVFEDHPHALGWWARDGQRVERHVGTARLVHREERHHQRRVAVQAHAHPRLRPHPPRGQDTRQALRAGIQLGVRQLLLHRHQRHLARLPPHLLLEQMVQTDLRGNGRALRGELHEHLLPLHRRQPRQRGERRLRSGHRRREQRLEAPHPAPHRDGVVERGRVLEARGEPVLRLAQAQEQVELRRAGVERQRRERQARQLEARIGGVLERQHHLEKRRVRQVPRRRQLLHHLLERQVLVRVGRHRGLPRAVQELVEARPAGEIGAQHQGVDEEADQRLDLGPVAARHRRAHGEAALAREPREQRLEAGEERHEERRAAACRERAEPHRQLPRQAEAVGGAGEALHRRPRPVGRQLERRQVRELRAPVAELPLPRPGGEPFPLPGGEVRVLDGQRRQRRPAAGGEGRVERGQLADEHTHGPAVGHDVVHHHQQPVLVRRQADQRPAQERPGAEVERPPREVAADLVRPLTGGDLPREVDHRQRQGRRRHHPRHRPPARLGEHRGERLVAAHDLGEARLERSHVERPADHEAGRDQVGDASGVQLVEQPEPLLGERQRQLDPVDSRRAPRQRRDGRQGRLPLAGCREIDGARQGGDRRVLEHGAQRQLGAEVPAQPRDQPRGRERVTAEGKEAVVGADPRAAQGFLAEDLCEQVRQRRLRGRLRRHVGPRVALRATCRRRGRERRAVHLAVGVERQGREGHEAGRHHEVRQAPGEGRGEVRGRDLHPLPAGHVGHELRRAQRVLARHHHRLAHPRMGEERRFDLAQLDAEAAHLDLVVEAAEKVEPRVRQEAHQVAGGVHPGAGPAGERVGHVALGGEPRPCVVAAGDALPRQEELAGNTDRPRPELGVDHEGAGVGHRPADGRRAPLGGRHHFPGGVGGVLGRAIEVDRRFHARHGVDRLHQGALERLAGEVDGHRVGWQGAHPHQLGYGRGHGSHQPHLGGRRVVGEMQRVLGQDHSSTERQRHQDLGHGDVPADRGHGGHAAQLPVAVDTPRPVGEHHRRAVLDGDTLGFAGRAGGVDEMGKALCRDRASPRPRRRAGVDSLHSVTLRSPTPARRLSPA